MLLQKPQKHKPGSGRGLDSPTTMGGYSMDGEAAALLNQAASVTALTGSRHDEAGTAFAGGGRVPSRGQLQCGWVCTPSSTVA
jgi:hypothetical protein